MILLGDLKEMIEDLERLGGEDVLEKEVLAEYDYGDHCHTRALVRLNRLECYVPYKTAYSDSGLAIKDDDEDHYCWKEPQRENF